MKTVAIIQARMGSTRLPGKVMKQLKGQTVLYHVIERVKQAKMIDEIVVATTTLEEDDILAEKVKQYGIRVFRGSSENVLSRYYEAAKECEADVVVRITSDCPLIDPIIVDHVIDSFYSSNCEIATNVGSELKDRTFPRGLDVEVFAFKSLMIAQLNASQIFEREHVTPYIYEHSLNIMRYRNKTDYSMHRWTLDTKEDFELITELYNRMYYGNHDFYLSDVIYIFENEPNLLNINGHIEQKKY